MRIGISGYDRDTRRRLSIVNMAGYLSALSSMSFVINFALYDFMILKWLILGNLMSAVLTTTAPYWHRYNSVASPLVMTITVAITLFFFVSELGRDSGVHLNYIGSVAIAFVIFGLGHLRIVAAVTAFCIVAHIACHFLFETGRVQGALDAAFLGQLYILSATTIMIILAVIVWYAFRIAANAEARSERLLNNVLPKSIANQLMQYPDDPIADGFDEATVLFADIVGFTTMSEELDPGEMVFLLNELFTGFDAVGTALNTEKIKTIGDAYMAVSGVPRPSDDHAEQILKLAIGMLEVAAQISREHKRKLNIRIGIATGPITAGVIGKAKFAYDVWSPTVNLAARLESSGAVGEIHVSQETRRALDDKYEFKKAPASNLKGIGRVNSWYLDREKL
ncbi:MAG: adenylate/guanylate cyclase domain-containing protein [Rhizobiaceae bacterium]